MTKQVLFIQGGGAGAYEEDAKLAAHLQAALGLAYHVHYPRMPDEDDPNDAVWVAVIAKALAGLASPVFLVGHSAGAGVVVTYLAEERHDKPLAGVFLLAAPYWGGEGWQVDADPIPADLAAKLPPTLPVFFYHSRDDEWVPFKHLALYAALLPQATIREFDGRGHQFHNDLSEVAQDIKSIEG